MSKKMLHGEEIYLAPGIRGSIENGAPEIIDEMTGLKLNPNCFLDQVKIYEREVKGWFLEPAQTMLNSNASSNSFIVLMVCMAYIEGVEQYKSGKSSNRQSQEFFIRSVKGIYGNRFVEKNLVGLYKKTRCGLFHNGMVGGGVLFNNEWEDVMEFDSTKEEIRINPSILLKDLRGDFEDYIESLNRSEENSVIRTNFQRIFSIF